MNSSPHTLSFRKTVLSDPARFLLFLFCAALFVQFELYKVGSRSLVGYHAVLALLVGILVADRVMTSNFRATTLETLVYAYCGTLIVPVIMAWDVGMSIILLIFSILSFLLGIRFGKYSAAERIRIYQIVMMLFLAATVLRNIIHINDLGHVYSRQRGCSGCFLATGGRNIESTMFSLLALLYRGRMKIFVGVVLTVTVVLFQSRIGLIGAGLYWFVNYRRARASYMFIAGFILAEVILLGLMVGVTDGLLGRFDLETELTLMRNGVGRLAMWSAAIEAIPHMPLGVGPGNAVPFINETLGRAFWENNIHNVYLTWVLELGLVHGVLVGVFCLSMLAKSLTSSLPEAPAVFFLTMSALIQFTGYDAIFWFLLGILVSASAERRAARRCARLIEGSARRRDSVGAP